MKKIILLLPAVCSFLFLHAQWDLGFGYSNQTPLGEMAENINAAHGFHLQAGYRLPFARKQFVASFETGKGIYGAKKVTQTFQSEDVQTPTEMPVHYINFAAYSNLNLRYEILRQGKIIPYVQLSGGVNSLGTKVRINIHEDQVGGDDCVPLEDEVTFRKRSMTWGYGGGLLINLANKRCGNNDNGTMLNISVNRIHGNRIDYVNVKELQQPVTPQENDDSKTLTMQFVNLNTNNIHNHTVARVYNSPLQQLQIKVGLLFKLF